MLLDSNSVNLRYVYFGSTVTTLIKRWLQTKHFIHDIAQTAPSSDLEQAEVGEIGFDYIIAISFPLTFTFTSTPLCKYFQDCCSLIPCRVLPPLPGA